MQCPSWALDEVLVLDEPLLLHSSGLLFSNEAALDADVLPKLWGRLTGRSLLEGHVQCAPRQLLAPGEALAELEPVEGLLQRVFEQLATECARRRLHGAVASPVSLPVCFMASHSLLHVFPISPPRLHHNRPLHMRRLGRWATGWTWPSKS